MHRIRVCSNEGTCSFPRGEDNEIVLMYIRLLNAVPFLFQANQGIYFFLMKDIFLSKWFNDLFLLISVTYV